MGKKTAITFLIFFLLSLSGMLHAASKQVLLLHDSSGPYGYLGREYAIMLENLLGHFDADITVMPVSSYPTGLSHSKDATFYIGSTYDEASYLPAGSDGLNNYLNFVSDAATTTKTVAWINHNLAKIAWEWNPDWGAANFYEKMGYWFYGTKNNNFNRVIYKDTELWKGVVPWVNPGADLTGCFAENVNFYACSPEINAIVITDPLKAQVVATTFSTLDLATAQDPYITRSNNFWFIGDIPFSYFSEEDRYLAFADVLHDILDSGITQQPLQAIVRLEDVSPGIDPSSLESVMTYLESENIPFAVAGISVFEDPNGVLSNGVPTTIHMNGSTIADTIRPFYDRGKISMVAHGYTHQFENLNNPYNALSGDDFEFYRVTINPDNSLTFHGPVPGDSTQWAKDRMLLARDELASSGFSAFAWEAPHYIATEADYLGIKEVYPVHYGRMVYFNNAGPAGRFIGQFFPYVIDGDYYGYRQIPENLGNIEPEPFLGYRSLLPEDLIRHAEKIKVVRDSVAGFYYHPYLGTGYLNQVVQGLQGLGYEFIAPCTLGYSCPTNVIPQNPDSIIVSPISDETLTAPVTIAGIATAPAGVDSLLLGIRDNVTRLWWNNGSWGAWVLNPIPVNPAGGTETSWSYSFDPTGSNGSGSYRLYARTKDLNAVIETPSTQVSFSVQTDSNLVLAATIDVPTRNQVLTLPAMLSGSATSPVGVDSVLIGIRDSTTKLWWNEGSWGQWVLNPAQINPANGNEVSWQYSFDPGAAGGSGKYRLYARAKDLTANLSSSTQLPFRTQ